MVTVKKKDGKEYFVCDACNMVYADRAIAEKCEAWCKKYKSCNMEIIAHAIKKRGYH